MLVRLVLLTPMATRNQSVNAEEAGVAAENAAEGWDSSGKCAPIIREQHSLLR
jgi:hypothetical protein